MEILSVARRGAALLGVVAALSCLAAGFGASAGEAFDATVRGKLMETGATSICDLDLENSLGRRFEVYGNVVATRGSDIVMSDPPCPHVVIGVNSAPPFIPNNPLQRHLFFRELVSAAYWYRPGFLSYCLCVGTIMRASIPEKYYLDVHFSRSDDYLPIQDAPAYPSKVVLEDGRIVPGPEFLPRRAIKKMTEAEWRATTRKPDFIPPSPW
ncbi:MAG: hypothetical protein J0I28_11790 [Caulobacterales bacterium]|nr:hypothetical protein [Caulobacterales bacterium]